MTDYVSIRDLAVAAVIGVHDWEREVEQTLLVSVDMATDVTKAAASDLDEAVQIEPQSLTAWTSRGLAYERLGEKEKAAGSYAKALNISRDHDPAKKGFARVGGRTGQTYQTF